MAESSEKNGFNAGSPLDVEPIQRSDSEDGGLAEKQGTDQDDLDMQRLGKSQTFKVCS
jgi:hypothetical protein